MHKKRYFILSPAYGDDAKMASLQDSAASYYGQKDYESVMSDLQIQERVREITLDRDEQNASLLLIGVSALSLAQCDSVFVANGWEEDDYCKFVHMLAFSHGIDIVYEFV